MAVVAGFALLAYWISNDVKDRYGESFEEIMVDTANLLAELITTDMNSGDAALNTSWMMLSNGFSCAVFPHIYELEKSSVDIQIYVTDDQRA